MTTEIQTQGQLADHEAKLVAGQEQLRHLLPSLRTSPRARLDAEALLSALTEPVDPVWLMARVASLLSPYYEKDIPQAVRKMEAQDWAAELAEYPQRVVDEAVRWWKSADNPDRRKRPFEGDIAARCKIGMGPMNAAKIYLSQPLTPTGPPREVVTPVSKAHRAKVAREAMEKNGFAFPKVGEGAA